MRMRERLFILEPDMQLTGGCHCGKITYEAEIDPEAVRICHCTDCQKLSGTAFRVNVQVKKENFHLQGVLKIYIKTAESGNKRAQAFCPDCGSGIYATTPDNPQLFGIRLGTADQFAQLRPKGQIWCRSAMPWLGSLPTDNCSDGQPV